jgi:hypothetical protein
MNSARTAFRQASAMVVLLAGAGFLTGCGSASVPPVRPAVTTTVTVTASPSATMSPAPSAPAPTGPPSCVTSALAASIGPGSGAAGSTYYPIEFTNTSGATCTLYGYPGVSFVAAPGTAQLGGTAARNSTFSPKVVTLAPGAVAHASVQVVVAQSYPASLCKPVTAHFLRVYPPGQVAPLYASLTAMTCTGAIPGRSTLGIYVVRPGANGP